MVSNLVAMISGFLKTKTFTNERVHVFDISEARVNYFKSVGIVVDNTIPSLVDSCDIIILAVKPDILLTLLDEPMSSAESFTPEKLFISIACGITIKQISDKIHPSGCGIVRLLPNTPCSVLKGICCYTLGPNTNEKTNVLMNEMFCNLGEILQIPEYYMDAVVALAGSGPAFIYMLIEALADGGVKSGLPRDLALNLSAYMVRGSAEMVISTHKHPAELKDQVCSPGGTTITGVEYLEDKGFRGSVMGAVFAAFCRGKEIGKQD